MKFFFDNNLPQPLAEAINILSEKYGHEATHLRKKFSQKTKDIDWVKDLSNDGDWIIITHDNLNKGAEREALRRAGLMIFFLDKSWCNYKFWDKAHQLVRWWPRIIEQAEGIQGAAAFKVPYRFSGKGKFGQVKI